MLSLIISLVLFSLAGAASTVPVSITVMILLSPDPRRGAVPFLAGSMAGSLVIVGLAAAGARYLPARPELDQEAVLTWLGLTVGVFLVCYAGYLFWHRGEPDSALLGKIRSRFSSARPWQYLVLGLGLNLRPKAILLAVTAGALISVRELPLAEGALFVVAFATVTQSAVVVPIAVWLHAPERAEAFLTAIYSLLQRNGRTITATATLIIGVFIIGSTIAGL